MATIDITMPRLGESVIECTVISILKKIGDHIDADDSVLEVATDKVDTEIPSASSGIITEILVKEGQVVAIGSPIMRLETSQSAAYATTQKQPEVVIEEAIAPIAQLTQTILQQPVTPAITSTAGRFYSPLVQTIAQAEGISNTELNQITGTGSEGRVTKNDIMAYLNNRQSVVVSKPNVQSQVFNAKHQPSSIEVIPMDRMRKMIAERMIESQRVSAHVSSYVECDMTNIVQWREQVKHDFKQKTGESLTYTPILIEALAQTIRQFPNINISVEGDNILKKNDINIGMAVALPSGNLIVPVIRNADQLDLLALTKEVNNLAAKARQNKLSPDDLAGGTYTMSNIGIFGNLMGTPIIVQPQVAIMAFGVIQKRPVIIETPHGDTIGVRSMMYLSHSYDHRVVDGALGGMFVRSVADYLEKFNTNRVF
jgi:2-oxoglutarate dehydrogenase E2 component (dihydrolipoamide succinyltransferase)